ncbi:MAG: Gfo/Idh/MocA family oxidoreductase [Clostridiales bacterium]|nr:Gfo/Idh/MocA family oxidoreductase [Clostridiales bacterium]
MLNIGVIGYGGRISDVIKMMMDVDEEICIKSITDVNQGDTKDRLKKKGLDAEEIRFFTDPDKMLDEVKVDGVLIGTRCSLHSRLGIKVLKRNIPLYLEKPVATNMDDLLALKAAASETRSEVVVSFPLRVTPIVKLVKEIIDSGKLGTIEHVQTVNNVPYGGCYFHDWYRDENETGGLFLQKATHDFDYINYLLGIKPVEICAMTSKQIFKGDKPEGLYCRDCDEKKTCPEGPFVMKYLKYDDPNGDMCCFAKDTGNEDSGSAIIRYETGMHVSYTQNFFARKKAAMRGARLLGYNGTAEFDWYTDEVRVFMHNTERVESYKFDSSKMSHGGGDYVLAMNFINVMKGVENSVSPLDAGLLSVLMCLKAKESALNSTFQKIEWPQ